MDESLTDPEESTIHGERGPVLVPDGRPLLKVRELLRRYLGRQPTVKFWTCTTHILEAAAKLRRHRNG